MHRAGPDSGEDEALRISLISLHYAEYSARLAVELARAHEVELHLSAYNAGHELSPILKERLSQAGVLVHLHRRPVRKAALADGWRLARAILSFRPDVVHAQEAAPWTLLVAWMLGVRLHPFALTVHDPRPHSGADMTARQRGRWPTERLRGNADALIVHGDSLVSDLGTILPSSVGRTHSVAHGVLGDFDGMAGPASADAGFLFFGRIQAYKGLGVLLDAADILHAKGLNPLIRVAGTGPDLEGHRERIAAMSNVVLDERFVPVEEVPELFASAGATVMPYTDATQSGVAAYALAAGRPVIVSRVGAMTEIVKHGGNGLVVQPRDAAGLANAMERLMSEPGLLARLSAGALETARTVLAWPVCAAKTVGVYDAAIGRKGGEKAMNPHRM